MRTKKTIFLISIILLVVLILFNCDYGPDDFSEEDEREPIEEVTPGEVGEPAEGPEEIKPEDTSEEVVSPEEELLVEGEAPTISLAMTEGPLYSAPDDICYYRIEATVTGFPVPTIEWSKDDSHGAFGPTICQVNLTRGEEYVLNATATNPVGSVSDSYSLAWGCGDLELADELPIDEDVLEEELIEDPDGEGSEESRVDTLYAVAGLSGSIVGDKELITDFVVLGDNDYNLPIIGLLSFDIRGLSGRTVHAARLRITTIWNTPGEASELGPLSVQSFNYGDELNIGDQTGMALVLTMIPTEGGLFDVNFSNDSLRDTVNGSIEAGRDYYQLRLGLMGGTDGDYNADKLQFDFIRVYLLVDSS